MVGFNMVEKVATYNRNIRCQFIDPGTGARCSMLSVQGNSLCAMHIHQRGYGDCFNGELSDIYSRVASSPQILDLSNELNVQRTLLVTVCNRLKNVKVDEIKDKYIAIISELSTIVAKTAKIMSDIEKQSGDSIHITEVKLVCDSIIAALVEMDLPEDKIKMLAEKFNKLSIPLYPR